jgi:N-acetyl-1-D-myo-inositol-2-amino-2-deoxy-alpha-D-glucopyranoside deacetylase
MSTSPIDISRLSILACYAHPDDEGFASGGLLAMLAAGGARVTLVCATNGDVGEISDPALATPENLWQVRKQELRNAMDITGIGDVRFLDYRDSGMDGSDDNRHPNAYCNAEADVVIGQLSDIIAEVNPHVVLTHDPSGGYGHPDHKTMCSHATIAAERASDPDAATPLLYYVCFPRGVFQTWWKEMTDRGITPPFAVDAIDSLGTPDEEVTTTLDVSAWVETKLASLACHRTQIGDDGPFEQLPQDVVHRLMRTEYYQLAVPAGALDLLAAL